MSLVVVDNANNTNTMNHTTSSGDFSVSMSNGSMAEAIALAGKAAKRFGAQTKKNSCAQRKQSFKFSANNFVTQRYDSFNEHYEIVELLGEGAYGEVYVCQHKESGAERAVKILKIEDQDDAKVILNEFDILRGIDHPNLLKIYQLYEDEETGTFYIVTDLYQGGELYDGKKMCELTFTGQELDY